MADWVPCVSVLMPVFNAEAYVGRAIESVLGQTFADFELLVIDDGSSDDSAQFVKRYADPRIQVWRNVENLGKPESVSRLFRFARGKFVTIHDADDVSLPRRFEKQVSVLESDGELGMCGTSYARIDDHGRMLQWVTMPGDYDSIMRQLPVRSQFCGATIMVRNDVLHEIGEVYRPYFRRKHEDNDLCYRVAERYKVVNLPDVLYAVRITPDSLSRRDADIETLNLYRFVVHLAEERRVRGSDCLLRGDQECERRFWEQVRERYRWDPSLVHREASSYYSGWGFTWRALRRGACAIRMAPFMMLNYKHFAVLLKQVILAEFRGILRALGWRTVEAGWTHHVNGQHKATAGPR
jgi:glycosyltransferase involved in cell wall biosynthesis